MDWKKRGQFVPSSRKRKQPFERDKNDLPLMRIVLHTSSLKDQILNEDETITSLLKLDDFPFLEVYLTPTNDKEIIEKLGEKKNLIINYHKLENKIKAFNREFIKYIDIPNHDLTEPVVENSTVNYLEFLISREYYFDFFIIDKNDCYFKSRTRQGQDITSKEALNYVRILLINLGIFKVTPIYGVSAIHYYRYRIQKSFPGYQKFRLFTFIELKNDKVNEQLNSLSRRLGLLLRIKDKIDIIQLKTPKPDFQDEILYHLGYFIMLITGVFDDIAWIIHELYSFKLENKRQQIKLRMDFDDKRQQFEQNIFFNKLSHSNKKLFHFLRELDVQSFINWIYPFRDTVQHRIFLEGIGMTQYNEHTYEYEHEIHRFSIPNEALDKIKLFNINLSECGIEEFPTISFSLFNAYVFVENSFDKLAYIVNNSLDLICLERQYNEPKKPENDYDLFHGNKPVYF